MSESTIHSISHIHSLRHDHLTLNNTPTTPSDVTTQSDVASSSIDDNESLIRSVYNNVIASPFYLGSPNLLDNVMWTEDGTTHRLIVKQQAREDDDTETSTVKAEIRWIAKIAVDSFWLYVDGGWSRKQNKFETVFEKTNRYHYRSIESSLQISLDRYHPHQEIYT
ncbi:hypothetical protein EW146_g6116 [Bondarzewia mesenterica]|uniref:Uncharacterized protein n=1 Tax=Bondarzewia mesenterica TaxID=1095465 RepID=A0A4S4LRJ9_9AGAM|nr:hypothetical protein EW146_g6116 [Bondarzewia mesenterica]